MRCPNCRAKVPKQYAYCPKCGLSVKTAREMGKNANLILTGLICAALVAGGLITYKVLRNGAKQTINTDVQPVTAFSTAETAAVPDTTSAPETTTEPETTASSEKSENAPVTTEAKKTSAVTSAATEKTTAAPVVTTAAPAPEGTTSADYYKTVGEFPFHTYDSGDPFLPPGLYTRSDNHDGRALSEAAAKDAMMHLNIDWGKNFDLYCGDTPDESGSSNSTYRYIANAFPVPGYSDLQLPAAIDLYIHNGDAAQGSYLRAVDYRFCNHDDYNGKYVWTKDEIAKIFTGISEYADGVYGGHTVVNDNNIAHYDYYEGALSIGYYERGGNCVLWISRAND